MKKLNLLLSLLLISSIGIAQTAGDFQTRHSGMWDNFSTWQRYDGAAWQNATAGQLPTNTSNVQILATHTVTQNSASAEAKNIIIDATAELVTGSGTSNIISIYGNLTNNGLLDFFDAGKSSEIIFTGTGDALFSGTGATTDIFTIEVAKSMITETVELAPDNFTVQDMNANAPKFLIQNTGTFKLSGNFNMTSETFVGGASYNFDNTKGFWLNNPNFEIIAQAGSFEYHGLVRISEGIFNVGINGDNRFYPNNSDAEFIMEGGTLNISGAFYSGGGDAITYNQSGGTINVATQQVTTGYQYCFRINESTASFTMSGGTINIIQANTTDREYSVVCSDATTNITGGTLNLGTASTASDFNFEIDGKMPNTVIHKDATAILRGTINVYNNLTVNGIFTYRDVSWNDVYLFGDLIINSTGQFQVTKSATSNRTQRLYIYGSIISDGILLGYWNNGGNEGRLYTQFRGTANETITGTGATCIFYDLRVNKGSDMTPTLEVLRPISIDAGDSNDGNRLYVENGTFKLSSNSNLTPYYNNQWINSTTGRFWLNHPDAIINWANVGNSQSHGEFILDAGTYNTGRNFFIDGSSTPNNQINGGAINGSGEFDMEQDVLMTAGTITMGTSFVVDANGADEYGDLTMTGGTIIAQTRHLLVSGKLNLINGDIIIGDDISDDHLEVYEGGTLQQDGGTITINGYAKINENATANNQINGGIFTATGDFDIEQHLLITNSIANCGKNFYADGNNTNEDGQVTIINAELNIGDGDDLFQITNSGVLNFQSGTINLFGRIQVDNGAAPNNAIFNMTGGSFNVDPQHTTNTANNVDLINFEDNAIVNFTGGILTIIDPMISKQVVSRDDIQVRGTTGAKNFAGSTISFGDGISNSPGDPTYHGYCIYAATGVVFGDIILNNPAGADRIFIGRDNCDIYCNNLTITSPNDKYVMNGRILNLTGDFINNGELDGTQRNTSNHLLFTGTNAQSYSGTGIITSNLNQLTINNTSATGLSLSADIGATQVNLTDGHVYSNPSPNGLLTVYGTATTNLAGGSSSNYVQGALRRAIPNTANSDDYLFPIGKSNYRLWELIGLKTSGSGDGFITSEFFPTTAEPATGGNGMADPLESNDVHWKINNDLSSVNIDHVASVRVTYTIGAPPPVLTLAQSNTGLNGTYDAIGRLITATTLQSEEYKSDAYATNAETYLCIGAVEPLEGTYTVGNSGDYLNLTEVAAELRIKYVNDWVVFEMLPDYDDATETFPVDFDVLMLTEPKYNVTIRPQLGVVGIETALDGFGNGAEIYINHIHDLRFDGRPGGVGAGDWLFEHRDATPEPVFTFKNNAYADTLSYLTIKSDIQTTTSGVILFEADNGDGNDSIVIDNCDITGRTTTPTIAIYSQGNSGSENDNNKIDNCNIYDYFNATEDTYGIYLGANNTDWTIENNRFYQTAPRIFTENQTYYGISINSGENHFINNNTIGYADNLGNNFTDISGSTSEFRGIYMSVGYGNYSNITNNTISGIKFSSSNSGNYFVPIHIINGDVNVGTAGNGNTIGSVGNFVDYPIQLTYNVNDGNFIGIYTQVNRPTQIIDNKIGGIKTTGNFRTDVFGVFTNNSGSTADFNISGNIIGSTTQANSFSIGTIGDTQHNRFYGIYNYRGDNVTISNNTIQNITSYSRSTSGDNRICGIYHEYDIALIANNTIGNLTNYSGNQNIGYNSSLVGIVKRSNVAGQTITGNNIFGLKSMNSNNRYIAILGMDIVANTSTKDIVSSNFIHNFNTNSNNGYLEGIRIVDGTYNIINNMIQLGIDENGNSVTNPVNIYGINYRNDEPVDFYHNSIYIGGTGVTNQADRHSYCIHKRDTELSIMKNNIFVNQRSNSAGTDSKHYALYLSYEDVVNSDYNIYYINGTGGVLANLDGADFITLRAMKAYADNGNDHHSGFGNPNFISPTGDNTTCDLHLQAINPAEGMGVALGIATDIDNEDRTILTPVDIGADAGNFTFNADVDIYSPNFEYLPIEPQSCGITTVDIDVRITDQGVGVPLAGANVPRLYYRDNSNPWATGTDVAGTLQSGDANDGVWRFTFTPLQNNKFYEYYFIAEDQANNPASEIANGIATTNNVNIGYSKYDDNSPIHTDVNNANVYPDGDVEIDVFTVCVYPAASYTIGNDAGCIATLGHVCDFETITAYGDFFFNMNAMIIDKNVTGYIVADTYEPAAFPANQTFESPINSNYQIRIEPYDASLKVLNSDNTINDKMIRFEGADRYTISGEFNADGNQWLEFSHDKDDQSVFYFKDDAQDITLEHLTIKGSGALDPRGTIFFDSTTVATPQGNKNIIIDNNKILAHTQVPLNAIYSYGGQANNSNIQITNNEIDAFQSIAIWATDHFNDNWTISNNIIYNTFVNDTLQAAISIESGSNHTISGNQIGGSDATLGGTAMTNTYSAEFNVIYMNVDDNIASNITNNTIKNIACNRNGWGNVLRGIRVHGGKVNITGNTLENFRNSRNNRTYGISYLGTSGISISNNIITDFTTTGNGDLRAFYINTDETDVNTFDNNLMKNLTVDNTGSGVDFYGLYHENGRTIITNNIIGGNNPSDKITHNGRDDFTGFYMRDGSGNDFDQTISDNQILNIEITNNNIFRGFDIPNTADGVPINITNNTVDNLNLNCSNEVTPFRLEDGEINVSDNNVGTATYGITNAGVGTMRGIYFSTNDNGAILDNNSITNLDNNGTIYGINHNEYRNQTISNNTIYGINTANDISFKGIYITNGNNLSVQGNTIQDIIMTNGGANTNFTGIEITSGTVNLGTTDGNLVGDNATANSISINGAFARGFCIANNTRTTTASDNTVANMTTTGANTQLQAFAITNTGGTVNFSDNTAKNINANGTANTSVTGFYIDEAGTKNISQNTVRDISTTSSKTDISDGFLASQGFHIAGTSSANISENEIYNISATGNANINVTGISENATNAQITKNIIHNISNATTGNGTVSGIVLYNLNAGYVANNMISIGNNDNNEYSGIWIPQANTNTKNIYFNSIYIGGTATGENSYAFLRGNNTTPLYIRNNIFSNFRTGGAGKHFAMGTQNTTWNSSFMQANGYYSTNSATIGNWNGSDNDFETLLTNVGETGTYLSTDQMPEFTDAANCDLHINPANSCGFNSVGEAIANVTDDYDGDLRSTNPDIGADEFTPTGRSGNFVWRGHSDNNWDDNGNWQCELAPSNNPGELIIIPCVTNEPIIGRTLPASTVLVDAMDIRQSGNLIINPGNSITLSGDLILNGTVTIETPANEFEATGSFIDNGTITGTGQMIAKRFLNGGQYHQASSPVKQGTGNNTSAIFTRSNPSGNYNANLYLYNEAMDLDGTVSTEPAGTFDNNNLAAGWYYGHNGEAGADINLVENKGYMFYTDQYQTLQFEGEPATGNYDATGLSFTNNDPDNDASGANPTEYNLYDGWHLLGNPYPSAIDWNLIRDDQISGIDDGIYVWDNTGYSGYKNGSQVQNGNLTNNIPPMQGFFVRTNGGATPPAVGGQNFVGSVEIRNEHRTHSGAIYLKSNYNHSNYLKLKTSANGHNDFIVVQFLPDATNEYDAAYDLVRMFVNPSYGDPTLPQLYSITENENDPLSLSVLPTDEMIGKIVPLGLSIGQAGNYTISVDKFNDFENVHVYLNDNLTNSKVNLRNTNTYSFDFEGGKIDDRFYLNFEANHAPVATNEISDKETLEDEEFTFTFANNTFIDEDFGDFLRYEVQNLPTWLNFNSETKTFSGVPLNQNVGEVELKIIAFDTFNESDTTNFKIKIINTNDAPIVANQIPDMQTNAGEIYSYQIPENIFYDIDLGDNLTLKANLEGGYLLPNWLSFNSETRTLSGKPMNAQIIDIEIFAIDTDGENVSDIFELTVLETLNISENNDIEIEIYPNPASNFVNINLTGLKKPSGLTLKITDVTGKLILEQNITSSETEINISKFTSGSYFIQIQNDETKIVKNFVKK